MVDAVHYDDLPMHWVGDWAGRRAAMTPRRVAIFDSGSGERFTYAEMNERANRVGTWLRDKIGLEKGDKICFIARNRVEPVDLYLAAGKCGFILAPLSYRLTKRELDDLLARIEPQAVFYEDVFAELAESLDYPVSVRERVLIGDGAGRYQDEILATEPENVNRPLALNDTFLYIHTGGTTATPKVCVVPHRQMLWNSFDLVIASGGALGEARELLTFPLFHIGGWNTLTPAYHSGGFTVLVRQFDPGLVLQLIETEQVTHFGAVEAMLQFIVRHPRFADTDLGSLQGITSAGAPCSAVAMRPFWERGVPVTQAYGLTEAGPSNFTHVGIDKSMDEIWEHNGSIGTPFFTATTKSSTPRVKRCCRKARSACCVCGARITSRNISNSRIGPIRFS
ncbi:AMP-binding protein [Alkalilimnicola ehrlichii]|uniref:AMP-binding protein n=1 Tax=Alkalilimnicola ehrlichii TaxID=351052 RepID=UPI002161F5D0|nr:AMP-binding protein [Alkalilimnicola ehrlichii]